MRQRLPPLEQIEAFVEAAKAPSFRAAAERCAISPAAFSRRIQGFSAALNVQLFERCANGVRLTAAGQECLEELEPAYSALRRAAASVSRGPVEQREVRLSLSHSLAVGWLIPRLDAFRAAHPGIEITIKTQRGATDIRRGDADLGFCFSDIDISGLVLGPTVPVLATPMAAPEFAAELREGGRDLARERLLGVIQHPDLWAWWSSETGRPEPLEVSANFDMLNAMYESAARGLGVAMGATPTAETFLQSGRLVTLDLPWARFPGGYRLVAAPDRRRRPAVAAAWRWWSAEVEGLIAAAA